MNSRRTDFLRTLGMCGAGALVLSMLFGVAYLLHPNPGSSRVWIRAEIARLKNNILPVQQPPKSYAIYEAYQDLHQTSIEGKKEIRCPQQTGKTMVLLVLGQSNVGNHSQHKFSSAHKEKVVNYFGGKCFVAASPLVGSSGLGGESLTLLGNLLVSSGAADRVVLMPFGVGGSFVSSWSPGGNLNRMLMEMLDGVKGTYTVTHVLWHQGESDFSIKTSNAEYTQLFNALVGSIRRKGVAAPIYVSVASRCAKDIEWSPDNPVVVAQRALPDEALSIYPGVNSDAMMNKADRFDGCHFSRSGQQKFAEAWASLISVRQFPR